MKQRTILREVSLSGNALHTGEPVTLTIKPAPVGNGIVFRRIDLAGQPEVKPRVDQVIDLVRATTISIRPCEDCHGGTCAQRPVWLRD